MDLVTLRPEGLYCPAGDFYIDPWRAVDRAVITHAHADHARSGHRHVLAMSDSEAVLRVRLGAKLPFQGLAAGECIEHHGVRVSLHPAGHVLGSAQVRLEHGGQVWVVSGDYYLSDHDESNPTCPPFEPVRCDCFITESTFGLPLYRWAPQALVLADINQWWAENAADGHASVLAAYSFGKAQRLLAGVDAGIGPILVHGSVAAINAAYRATGVHLPAAAVLDEHTDAALLRRALVVAPPNTLSSAWARHLGPHRTAFASGWMQLRKARQRQRMDRGFALSDHADWPGLQRAIAASGAERIIVTHGDEAALLHWMQSQGLRAETLRTPLAAAESSEAGEAGVVAD